MHVTSTGVCDDQLVPNLFTGTHGLLLRRLPAAGRSDEVSHCWKGLRTKRAALSPNAGVFTCSWKRGGGKAHASSNWPCLPIQAERARQLIPLPTGAASVGHESRGPGRRAAAASRMLRLAACCDGHRSHATRMRATACAKQRKPVRRRGSFFFGADV